MAKKQTSPALPLLTTDDVATRTRTCPDTIRRLVRDGRGPASIRLGGRLRFKAEAVEAWIDAGFAGSAPAAHMCEAA